MPFGGYIRFPAQSRGSQGIVNALNTVFWGGGGFLATCKLLQPIIIIEGHLKPWWDQGPFNKKEKDMAVVKTDFSNTKTGVGIEEFQEAAGHLGEGYQAFVVEGRDSKDGLVNAGDKIWIRKKGSNDKFNIISVDSQQARDIIARSKDIEIARLKVMLADDTTGAKRRYPPTTEDTKNALFGSIELTIEEFETIAEGLKIAPPFNKGTVTADSVFLVKDAKGDVYPFSCNSEEGRKIFAKALQNRVNNVGGLHKGDEVMGK